MESYLEKSLEKQLEKNSNRNKQMFKKSMGIFALFTLLVIGFAQSAYAATASLNLGTVRGAQTPHDTATYKETVVDLELQTLGGVLRIQRQFANHRWTFNPDWANLQFFGDKKEVSVGRLIRFNQAHTGSGSDVGSTSIRLFSKGSSQGQGNSIIGELSTVEEKLKAQTIYRNNYPYKAIDGSLLIYRNNENKTIRRMEQGGYRWGDGKGNWIEYDEHGKVTRFGNRKNIVSTLVRNSAGIVTGLQDHFGTQLVTWTLDANNRPDLLTDYTNRTVDYTWSGNQLRTITDVRGNQWSYTYSDADDSAVIKTKTDPENRTISIEHKETESGFKKALSEGLKLGSVSSGPTTGRRIGSFSLDRGQLVLDKISDAVGTQIEYEFFYDAPTKTYRTTTVEAGRGRVAQTVNLQGEVISKYINDELIFDSAYSNNRRHMVQTDKNGNTAVWDFDEYHNPTHVTWADGTKESWSYNQYSQVKKYTNAKGVVTENQYDPNGNILHTIEAKGTDAERTTDYEYDDLGRLVLLRQQADATTLEAVTRWTSHDNYGNPLTQIDAQGVTTHFTWDAMGNMLTYKDGNNNAWSWTYDAAGNLKSETNPLNLSSHYFYDKVGNLHTITDALGVVQSTFTYNARDSITSITNAYGKTQSYVYNDQNQMVEAKDENNKISRLAYDASGRPKTVTDAVGNTVSFEWAKDGAHIFGLNKIHYPTFSERYQYDKRYRITNIQRYSGDTVLQSVGYAYDDVGNLEEITDPAGRKSKKFYDERNRLVSMQDPALNYVKMAYDDRDNLLHVTNELNTLIRQFSYSLRNEQTQITWPNGNTFTNTWDDNGNLKTYTDGKGQIQRHTWDAANRLEQTDYFVNAAALTAATVAKSVSYSYNNVNSLTGYNDGVTSAVYGYDDMQRHTSASVNYGPFTRGHSYGYNNISKKGSLTNPDGSVNQYFYDNAQKLNRINLVGEGNITVNSFNWLAPEKITMPGGNIKSATYDPLMRVKTIKVTDPAKNTVLDYSYDYNNAGNIEKKTTEHGSYDYGYDDLDRLLTANSPNFGAEFGETAPINESFSYDATGNRKTDSVTTGQWQYNSTNQLLQAGTDGPVFTYDANGNVETRTFGAVTETYVYNIENRLAEVRDTNNTLIASYTYDPFGRRLSKTAVGEGTRYFYYSDEGLIAEFDALGVQLQSYGYTPDGLWGTDPVFNKNGGDSYAYYLNDHLGTPQQLIQGNGAVVWSGRYRAFGLASVKNSNSANNPLRFAGQYGDGETSTHYNMFRDYDPGTGRYLQSDPIGLGGGINTYAYVEGNPLRYSDPYGLAKYLIIIGDPGLGHHNTGTNFNRAAQTAANNLTNQGHTVVSVNASTVGEMNAALSSAGLLDGGFLYYGHGWDGVLYPGEDPLPGTNVDASNLGSLTGGKFGSNATGTLYSCNSGSGNSNSIAQQFADQLGIPVDGFTKPLGFTGTPGKYLHGANAKPPASGPLYLTPPLPSQRRTFNPPAPTPAPAP